MIMIISSNLLSIDMESFTLKAKFPNWKHDFFFRWETMPLIIDCRSPVIAKFISEQTKEKV